MELESTLAAVERPPARPSSIYFRLFLQVALMKLLFGAELHQCLSEALRGALMKLVVETPFHHCFSPGEPGRGAARNLLLA
jgi:hypothetical protein